MNNWIDYDMLISEIKVHRRIAQGRVSEFKKNENPSALDKQRYHEAVGEELVLTCLQAWCNDFKFSSDEVKEIIEEKEELTMKQLKVITTMSAKCYDCVWSSDNTCMKHEKTDNYECYESKEDEDPMMKLQKSLP